MCRSQLSELRREVEVLQEQRHPNVVLFMGVCVRPPAVITEFCESGSLNRLLEEVILHEMLRSASCYLGVAMYVC
jgi:hypothetical protein